MVHKHTLRGLVWGVAVGVVFGGSWFAYAYKDIDKVMLLPGEPRSNVIFSDLETSFVIFLGTGALAGLIAALKSSLKDTHDA